MARRIRAREALRLRASGLSQNAIARAAHMSKHSVREVLDAAEDSNLTWDDAEGMTDSEVYGRLFPDKAPAGPVYPDPDWDRVHRELARTGVTLKLLHSEYAEAAAAAGEPAMSYDRFCKRYGEFTVRRNVVSRVGHKAGRNMEVDWSGPTMALVDPVTGEVSKVYLFVACLPFSRYSYVEPTLDMRQDTWLRCHVHAFEFLGGSTPVIVPDNLKTGVRSHPREGEVALNPAYEEMAAHYGAAVIPARVRRPRDKAGAENEVWSAATYVIAALRGEVFTDMGALRAAVAAKVREHNARPFSKREGSRLECFEEVERPLLRPLPRVPYEICEWVYGRKVQANCHVSYRRNFYSVSHLPVGRTVDLRVTESRLEVFLGGERVATHPLLPAAARNRYSTNAGDMPEGKSYGDWDAARIRRWADRVGPSCREAVDRVFGSYEYEEQAFNGCLALLRLSNRYSAERLERACAMSLASGKRSPRYRDVKPILETNQDRVQAAGADAGAAGDEGGYVRGAGFYGGGVIGMEVDVETARKLREMGAIELLDALRAQDDSLCMGMTCAERLQAAVDEAHSSFISQKVRNLTKRASLRYPEADVRSIDFSEGRGLDRVTVAELATCGFAERGDNVVLLGPTGTGKTYLSCALAKAACAKRIRTCYIRQPDLEDLWRESRDRPGGERKLLRKYGAFGLLVIDEWLLERPDELFRGMLLELFELRYGRASTVLCTQFRKKDWHPRLGGAVHADAIMDRIVHNAVWLEMGEMNMRQAMAGKGR